MIMNILVYQDCSNIVEILKPLCAGEEINIQKLESIQMMETSSLWNNVHLVLLDIFPNDEHRVEGIKLIKKIRDECKAPIIVISNQKSEAVKIMALEAGADDFVSTEANPLEVFARIKSQLRRYTQMACVNRNIEQIFRVDGLEIDGIHRKVTVDGREVYLTSTEYKILRLLIKEKGKVFSVDEIYEAVWGMRPVGADNTIAVHIRHIREKIEKNPAHPHYIKVEWGKGYVVG